ncbi:hypothetical protein BaRGS_00030466 [Batillaria attramentaria]|uniref:Uncharacterized protein n=1 Tax=Batillaria attramentaria TaxID=370345 RepID=A0ABD0JUH5_9CAEN
MRSPKWAYVPANAVSPSFPVAWVVPVETHAEQVNNYHTCTIALLVLIGVVIRSGQVPCTDGLSKAADSGSDCRQPNRSRVSHGQWSVDLRQLRGFWDELCYMS